MIGLSREPKMITIFMAAAILAEFAFYRKRNRKYQWKIERDLQISFHWKFVVIFFPIVVVVVRFGPAPASISIEMNSINWMPVVN